MEFKYPIQSTTPDQRSEGIKKDAQFLIAFSDCRNTMFLFWRRYAFRLILFFLPLHYSHLFFFFSAIVINQYNSMFSIFFAPQIEHFEYLIFPWIGVFSSHQSIISFSLVVYQLWYSSRSYFLLLNKHLNNSIIPGIAKRSPKK